MQEAKQKHSSMLARDATGSIPYHVLSCDIILPYCAMFA